LSMTDGDGLRNSKVHAISLQSGYPASVSLPLAGRAMKNVRRPGDEVSLLTKFVLTNKVFVVTNNQGKERT
jgi:hypothetical protein